MILTVFTAQPFAPSFNAALAEAYVRGARAAGSAADEVRVVDLTALRFDPVLRSPSITVADDEPDLARARADLLAADHVVFFFPVYWAGLPAIVKAFVDRVLLAGWAFRFEGGPFPVGLLKGRSARYVATMDSPWLWYLLAHHDALAGSFGRGTLAFVGLGPIERTMIYGVRSLSLEARATWERTLEAVGRRDVERARARLGSAPKAPARLVVDT